MLVPDNKFLGIRYDFWLHFLAGYGIMLTSLIFFDYIISVLILLTAAGLKEWYDEFHRNSYWDWGDLNWTLLGGILAYGVFQFAIYIGVL
jgi:hypothetical protein